ncbi:MAG: nucleotidyltransferase domain-containing protein [Bdellovibrio sp.]
MNHNLNLVRKIKKHLRNESNILIGYIGGSLARQVQDSLSDIDICLMGNRILSIDERKEMYLSWGVDEILILDEATTESLSGVADAILIDNTKVDINTLSFQMIDDLVRNNDQIENLTPNLSELFFALNMATPIKGNHILAELLTFIKAPTSAQLQNSVIQYLLMEEKLDTFKKAHLRGDHLQMAKMSVVFFERLYYTVNIVSGRYFPGLKRSQLYIQRFNLHLIMPGIEKFWYMSDQEKIEFLTSSFSQILLKGLVDRSA